MTIFIMDTTTVTTTKIITKLVPVFSWQTILYNCDCHTFDEVIEQLRLAIACTEATASQYAHTVHTLGCAAVFKGSKEKCEQVADVLGSIGLDVKVVQ